MIGFSLGGRGQRLDDDGILHGPLKQASRPGKGQPGEQPFDGLPINEERRGGGDPEAKAAETIQQTADLTVSQPGPKSDKHVRRAVLA